MKKLLIAFFLLLVLAGASAFQLKTSVLPTTLTEELKFYETRDDYEKKEVIGVEGDELFTLSTRHNAGKVDIAPASIKLYEGEADEWIDNYAFILEGYWPKAYLRGGNCAGASCTNGQMVWIKINSSNGTQYCSTGFKSVERFLGTKKCDSGDIAIEITGATGPEYKETWLYKGSWLSRFDTSLVTVAHQTWYLLLGPEGAKSGMSEEISREVIVDFCVRLKIGNEWTECVDSFEELEEIAAVFAVDGIADSTGKTVGIVDGSIHASDGSLEGMETELDKCNAEFNRSEVDGLGNTLLVSKIRFKYGEEIGFPPGVSGHNQFLMSEIDSNSNIQLNLEGFDGPEAGVYNIYMSDHIPREVDLDDQETTDPKFKTWMEKDNSRISCTTYWTELDKDSKCDVGGAYGGESVRWKIYKYDAPYFKETTPGQKELYNQNEILTKGRHCFDVWAYYMVSFQQSKNPDSFTWWMKSMEEIEAFETAKRRGYNLEIVALSDEGYAFFGSKVRVQATVGGEDFAWETITDETGSAKFIVPIDTSILVTVDDDRTDNIVVTGIEPVRREVLFDSFDMKFVYSRPDFWSLYYNVLPAHVGRETLPAPVQDHSFLESNAPSEEQYDEFYLALDKFLTVKDRPCLESDAGEVEFSLNEDYVGESILAEFDGVDYEIDLFYIAEFNDMMFSKTYYACYQWPFEDGFKTVQMDWVIDSKGTLTEGPPITVD